MVVLVPLLLFLLSPTPTSERVQIRIDAQQAHAILAVLDGSGPWDRVTRTEAYVRLKKRESERGRGLTDDEFRTFVESPELKMRTTVLFRTLKQWTQADIGQIANRVMAYLPPEATIKTSIYIVIKPPSNSFVYEAASNPAIFLYLDPSTSRAEFENTVAHELHHIGLASVAKRTELGYARLSPNVRAVAEWVGAFGEGLAMLGAAGSADIHPHQSSSPEDRARWDRDVANFENDMRSVEAFFLQIIRGELDEAQQRQRGMSFFGTQGPWYTVGWKMAVTVEKALGRPTLVACMHDPRDLLVRYNEAAEQLGLPRRSAELVSALRSP